jgi:hypothetical protein
LRMSFENKIENGKARMYIKSDPKFPKTSEVS